MIIVDFIIYTLEIMGKLKLLWLLLIYGLLSACIGKEKIDIFSKVEEYVELYPDSALWLLKQIPHPEKFRGKQRADYALLLTQAQDKNYLDSLQSDSLIKFAVDYYKDGDDKVKAGKALFYYGKMMALQENDTLAMQTYLNALERLEKTEEYKLQGLVYEYMGYINRDRKLYGDAINNYQSSVTCYRKADDTLGIIYIYRDIARVYITKQNYDSAYNYIDQAVSLYEKAEKCIDEKRVLPSLLHMKGLAKRDEGDLIGSISLLKEAIESEKDIHYVHHYSLSLGNIYLSINRLNEARECFELALTSERNFTKAGAYHYLYLLEKQQQRYAKALSFKEKSDSLLSIVQNADQGERVMTLQRKYENEKMLLEKQQLKHAKEVQLYSLLLVIVLIILFGFIAYLFIKKRYEKRFQKSMQVIARNEELIQHYTYELGILKQKEGEIAEKNKVKIGKLNQKILLLETENKKIRENVYVSGAYLLEQLKENKLILKEMTQQEKRQVLGYIDIIHANFISRLKKEFDLNDGQLMLIALLKVGFTSNDLAIIFDCELKSVFRNKSRLKNKMNLDEKDKIEKFIAHY